MTPATWVLLAFAGVFAVVDWAAVARGAKPVEYVAKPATLAALLGTALVLDPSDGAQRAWFVVALAFSLAGDVFLMLPRDLFVAGLGAFLLAHVAYIVGINLDAGSVLSIIVAAVLVVAVAGPVVARIVPAVARRHGKLLVPVVTYMVVISAMLVSALATGAPLLMAGALLFYVSDACIGWNRFVRPAPWLALAIIVTYHLGQAGLVVSLV